MGASAGGDALCMIAAHMRRMSTYEAFERVAWFWATRMRAGLTWVLPSCNVSDGVHLVTCCSCVIAGSLLARTAYCLWCLALGGAQRTIVAVATAVAGARRQCVAGSHAGCSARASSVGAFLSRSAQCQCHSASASAKRKRQCPPVFRVQRPGRVPVTSECRTVNVYRQSVQQCTDCAVLSLSSE
eukprot:scaffold31830_cov129-Isochrysis_galbana.AAC.3